MLSPVPFGISACDYFGGTQLICQKVYRSGAYTELNRIAAASGLSRDTYEIVTRTLGENPE